MTLEEQFGAEPFCYLTTTGRVSGRPHTIEIWFALAGTTAYLLAGGGDRSDWVRNLQRDPKVRVRIRDRTFEGRARVLEAGDEERAARTLVHDKYRGSSADSLVSWRDTALPVAIDLDG